MELAKSHAVLTLYCVQFYQGELSLCCPGQSNKLNSSDSGYVCVLILSWAKNSCGLKFWSVLFVFSYQLKPRRVKFDFWPKEIQLGERKCEFTHQLPSCLFTCSYS